MNTLAQWEDEDNQRQVQFSIAYSVEGSKLVLNEITPTKVSFICPESNTVLRSVGVHTPKGKEMLKTQFADSGKLDELMMELGKKHGLLAPVE